MRPRKLSHILCLLSLAIPCATAAEAVPLSAVTDNTVATNSTDFTVTLEALGLVLEDQTTEEVTGESVIRFDEGTRMLTMDAAALAMTPVQMAFQVFVWEVTGIIEAFEATLMHFDPAYVDPVDGSFTSFMQLEAFLVFSGYINGDEIVEDTPFYVWSDPFEVSGRFVEIGGTDADEGSGYELTLTGSASMALEAFAIPIIGDIILNVDGNLDLGFTAVPLLCEADESLTAPTLAFGNTCGAVNGCSGMPSEEYVYEVTLPREGDWTFSLCGSSFDTYLLVGTTPGGDEIGADDDGCPGLQSKLTANLPAGTYYATVEGWSRGSCGEYALNVYTPLALVGPADASGESLPVTFEWKAGTYDLFRFYSLFFYDLGIWTGYAPFDFWLSDDTVTMPASWWGMLGTSDPCYWTVLGVHTTTLDWDLAGPWSFTKLP
jgi:hypothetical protein